MHLAITTSSGGFAFSFRYSLNIVMTSVNKDSFIYCVHALYLHPEAFSCVIAWDLKYYIETELGEGTCFVFNSKEKAFCFSSMTV